jgi:hypothetical protein
MVELVFPVASAHHGIRIAISYTKIYNRLLVPLTAADQPQAPPDPQAALSGSHHKS